MKLDEQAAAIASKADMYLRSHGEEFAPTVDDAMELLRKLAEIVVVLAVRHEVDPL